MTHDDLWWPMSSHVNFFLQMANPKIIEWSESRRLGRSLWTQTTDLVGAYELKLLKVVRSYVGFSARRAGEQEVWCTVNSLAKRSTRHQRMKLRECLPFLWLSHLQFVSYDVKCNYRNYLHNVVLTFMCRHHHIIYIISGTALLGNSFVRNTDWHTHPHGRCKPRRMSYPQVSSWSHE